MKKILALVLCLVLTLTLFVACADDAADTTAPSDSTVHDHNHINFKGLQTATFTTDDLSAAMGRAPDFVSEQANGNIYIYNNVDLDGILFTQVQFTFNGDFNRISCTYSGETGLEDIFAGYQSAMTGLYGEPSLNDQGQYPIYTWRDGHTGNYVMLTNINDTTVQLAFYLYEVA